MAPALTEGRYPGDFLLSESPGTLSRDRATVTVPAETTLAPGTVLGVVAGTYVPVNPDESDGSEVAVGLLYAELRNAGTSPATQTGVVLTWGAEVRTADLVWPAGITSEEIATALAQLATRGLKGRD